MGFLGAGLLVGAATAVTNKLSDKSEKEEARYAFLKEAVDKGDSEFQTGLSEAKGFNKQLYADTKDWVTANILKDVTKTDGNNVAEYSGTLDLLDSMGVPVYVQGPKATKVINPNINTPENQKILIEGLTKIGLAKIVSAQRSGNFDINSEKHRHAVLDVRLGGQTGIKASVLRENMEDPRSPIVNKSIVNDGFDLGQYSEPIAEKVGLGKRISNFFNAADDTELIRRLAKEKGISIKAAERLASAGQTDEMDAFQSGSLEERLGSQYGDLPDISLSNVSTLIPSDAKTIADAESYIMNLIVDSEKTIVDASYKDPTLSEMPNNINFDENLKLFIGKDGKEISNEDIIKMYSGYVDVGRNAQNMPEGNIQELLPEYDPSKGFHRNDPRNLTTLMKRYALLFEASRGKDTQNVMEGINDRLEDLNLPGIGSQFNDDNYYVESFDLDKQHLVDVNTFTFGFKGSRPDQRISASEFLYQIMSDLAKEGAAAEDIATRAHIIFQRYLTAASSKSEMKL